MKMKTSPQHVQWIPRGTCDNPTRNHAELEIIASSVTQLGIISSSVVQTSNC